MASKIAARYISRRLSSSGKILSEEEKAVENIYIKILSLDSQRGSVTVGFIIQDLKPIPPHGQTKDEILIFFKLYEPEKKELRLSMGALSRPILSDDSLRMVVNDLRLLKLKPSSPVAVKQEKIAAK